MIEGAQIYVSIAIPLTLIFNKSMKDGVLPFDWKDANITPIYEKGSHKESGNYRPVSLTSVAAKVMESIVRDAIIKH